MNHAFLLHISLPSLYDYDLKLPDYTCYGGRKCKTTIVLFLFLILDKVIQDYLQKNRPHLTNWTRLNCSDEVWNSANSSSKWRFRCRCRRVSFSSSLLFISLGKKGPICGSCICGDTNTLEIRRWPGLRTDPAVPPLSGSSLFTHSWVSRIPDSGDQSTWKWGCNLVTVSGEFNIITSRK